MTEYPSSRSEALAIGFNPLEDRIILDCGAGTGAAVFLLTRRLTAQLLNGIAAVLERSNALASKTAGDVRTGIILMERQGALAHGRRLAAPQAQKREGELKVASPVKIKGRLVTNVQLTTKPRSFELVLQAGRTPPATLVLSRMELHRILEVLKQQAEKAGWNIQLEADWLEDHAGQLTLN